MDHRQLLRLVGILPKKTPILMELEEALGIGAGYGGAWYSSQKEHWQEWLRHYHTTGPYGRKPKPTIKASSVYNRIMCPPMIFWLPEAVGVEENFLRLAMKKSLEAKPNHASRSAAIRHVLSWKIVHQKISETIL